MNDFFYSIASVRRRFVILVILSFSMFGFMQVLFASAFNHVPGLSGPPILPDTRLYYAFDELLTMLGSLGPQGRHIYFFLHVVDMIFPLAYGLFFAVTLTLIFRVWGSFGRISSVLVFLPLVAATSDCVENVSIEMVSAHLTTPNLNLASAAGFATASKWIFTALTLLAILSGVVLNLFSRNPSKARRRPSRIAP